MQVVGSRTFGTYDTARAIAGIFTFFGWALVVIGAIVAIVTFAGQRGGELFIGFGAGVAVAGIGFLQVAAGQIVRATVDTADYSRQSLILHIGLAEGCAEIDLQSGRSSQSVAPKKALGDGQRDGAPDGATGGLFKNLSGDAVAALRKATDRGYDVRLSSDERSVIVTSGDWQTTLSSESEIVNFGQSIR
jgi:hypothetical protein